MRADTQSRVLLQARLSADGRTVIVAPGVEIPVGSVFVCGEVPEGLHASRALILFFARDEDVRDFTDTFLGAYDDGAAVPLP